MQNIYRETFEQIHASEQLLKGGSQCAETGEGSV